MIKACGLLAAEKKITSLNLALVLVHDLLLARGIQAGDGPVKQAVLRHKTRLQGEWTKMKIKKGAKSNEDLAQAGDQRAGVSEVFVSSKVAEAAQPSYHATCASTPTSGLSTKRSNPCKPAASNSQIHSPQCTSMFLISFSLSVPSSPPSSSNFLQDAHVPELILFSPKKAFHDDAAYKTGKLILQDKASCFPPLVLNPPASNKATVIDATAAPGNKTTYLSALMGNKGKVCVFAAMRMGILTVDIPVVRV